MSRAAFRLTGNMDPEERLEEAALWKAMYDFYGPNRIFAFEGEQPDDDTLPVFGRSPGVMTQCRNPVPTRLDYWTDPAFLENCQREFHVASLEDAEKIVKGLQSRGKGAFLKSTRLKHHTQVIGPKDDFMRTLGAMAYSFIDGPSLMVQEFAKIEFEYRYFVIESRIVTSSPNMIALTPIDYPLAAGTVYRTPETRTPEQHPDLIASYDRLVKSVIDTMGSHHACIDVGLINGKPGVVEMNPMQLGQVGLFACSVRELAAASESLVNAYVPNPRPQLAALDEQEFEDFKL